MKTCEVYDQVEAQQYLKPRRRTPEEEIFRKTLGFFCTLLEKGCGFDLEEVDDKYIGISDRDWSDSESEDSDSNSSYSSLSSNHVRRAKCKGQLQLHKNTYGQPFIQYVLLLS